MTTRFLYCSLSAALFVGETTLDEIHEAWAEEACRLFHEGYDDSGFNMHRFQHLCLLPNPNQNLRNLTLTLYLFPYIYI